MIINFNDKSAVLEKYTPLSWECLGFKFRNDDTIYKLNCINKHHNPLLKKTNDSDISYHLIYDNNCISSLILKIIADGNQKLIDNISPICYSSIIPKYKTKLEKIENNNKYLFTFFDNKNNDKLFSCYTSLPFFQDDIKKIDINSDQIVEGGDYILSSYIMTTSAYVFDDEESFKTKIFNINNKVISDYELEGFSHENDSSVISIGGKVLSANVHFNIFTGLRFYEIMFVCKNNKFIAYMPSNFLNKFPSKGDYICCYQFMLSSEIVSKIEDKNYHANSHIEGKFIKEKSPILHLDMQYIKGFENNIVKIKKDTVFDGDFKIRFIDIKLYKTKIKVSASISKDNEKSQIINISKDGNFANEIKKLEKLKLTPKHDFVEDLIDGVYWYATYKDIYFEGHENRPTIIEDIKSIINFNEIIDALHSVYNEIIKNNKQDKD